MELLKFIQQPWPWWAAGIVIGLTVPALLLLGNKTFGISSNLRHICAACLPAKVPFFQYEWKKEIWNFFFVGGVMVGAFIASHWLLDENDVILADSLKADLIQWGITDWSQMVPADIFSFDQLFTFRGFVIMIVGGFLVGFGTRYAGGCTSGHAIMGLSNLQWPSLVATCCFMIGGIIGTRVLLPWVLTL